jgi:hypothetical protein
VLFDAQNNLQAIFGLDTNSAAITSLMSSTGSLNLFGSNGVSSGMRPMRPQGCAGPEMITKPTSAPPSTPPPSKTSSRWVPRPIARPANANVIGNERLGSPRFR